LNQAERPTITRDQRHRQPAPQCHAGDELGGANAQRIELLDLGLGHPLRPLDAQRRAVRIGHRSTAALCPVLRPQRHGEAVTVLLRRGGGARLPGADDAPGTVRHSAEELVECGRRIDRQRCLAELLELRGIAPQRFALLADLFGLLVEVDEHRHLGAQHVRLDGRQDVVDRPERIPASGIRIVAVCGHEDDRGVLGAAPLANQRRGLEDIHPGHHDVEKDGATFRVRV
jgi:hypothetical protein